MISASRPRLPKITVVETGFLISEVPSVLESIPLVDLSSSHQVAEDEGELDQPEEGFGVFDLANQSEDPPGDIRDPALSEAELSSVGTSSQAEMGLKKKPRPVCSNSSKVNQGRVRMECRNPMLLLYHLRLRLSRLGHPPQSHSHNPPAPNFLLLPNQLCLLGRKALI